MRLAHRLELPKGSPAPQLPRDRWVPDRDQVQELLPRELVRQPPRLERLRRIGQEAEVGGRFELEGVGGHGASPVQRDAAGLPDLR